MSEAPCDVRSTSCTYLVYLGCCEHHALAAPLGTARWLLHLHRASRALPSPCVAYSIYTARRVPNYHRASRAVSARRVACLIITARRVQISPFAIYQSLFSRRSSKVAPSPMCSLGLHGRAVARVPAGVHVHSCTRGCTPWALPCARFA
jgi:hypothetical protein